MTFRTNVPPLSIASNDPIDRRWVEQIAKETPHNPPLWEKWTPSYTNLTVGNGGVHSRWTQNGSVADVNWALDLGSTSAVSGAVRISLPVEADVDVLVRQNRFSVGTATYTETGVRVYFGACLLFDENAVELYVYETAATYLRWAALGASAPFTWATDDRIGVQCSYRVAT